MGWPTNALIASQFPCRECSERYPGCHSECKAYLEVKANHDRKKEAYLKDVAREGMLTTYQLKEKKKNSVSHKPDGAITRWRNRKRAASK